MALKLSGHNFSGEDLIMVVYFLTRLVREGNIQEMSEAQAIAALPSFLDGFAKSQYETGAETVFPEEGGISSWPEAVQYRLRNYAQSSTISLAIADLRAGSQGLLETERELATRMNQTVCRCGNAYPPEEVLTLYIDAHHPPIYSLVAWFRESHRGAPYPDVVEMKYAHRRRQCKGTA